jgi:glycosyltransferase involved in cell wall biosynthesis
MSAKKILIIGPSISRTKGGMATVTNDMLQQSDEQYQFEHIVSHVEGSAIEKIVYIFKSLSKLFFKRNYSIVHIHVASGASIYRKSLFVFAAKLLNKPVILHAHGGDFHNYYNRQTTIIRWFIRKMFSASAVILVLTEFWKTFFESHITKSRVVVLHNGVHADAYKQCFTSPAHINHFLYLGRFETQKGIYDLLDVIDDLVNKNGQKKLRFFFGGYGETEKVNQFIQERHLEENVRILGWVNDQQKLEWLGKVETLLLPSYYEGLPMAILEAMAAGKIIISTDVGGIPDLVKNGENGFLFKPADKTALKKHILHVVSNPDDVVNIGEKNMAIIKAEYDLNTIFFYLKSIYDGVVRN